MNEEEEKQADVCLRCDDVCIPTAWSHMLMDGKFFWIVVL